MKWFRRKGNTEYTEVTQNIEESTTANANGKTKDGVSVLTVTLTTNDDGVNYKCEVKNRQATLYAETAAITVYGLYFVALN